MDYYKAHLCGQFGRRLFRVFYVGMLKPCRDPSHVNVKALAPRKATVSQDASFGSKHPSAPPVEDGAAPASADVFALRQACTCADTPASTDGAR